MCDCPSSNATRELPPPDVYDPVIEYYMQFVDRTVLRENLRLTVDERVRKYQKALDALEQRRNLEDGFLKLPDGGLTEPTTAP